MLKREVKVNGRYTAKISNRIAIVRITGTSRRGGWQAVNESTGRTVFIKTAGRLRSAVTEADVQRAKALFGDSTRVEDAREEATMRTTRIVPKVVAVVSNEPEAYPLVEAIEDAIRFLGDFVYNGAESGMKDDIDRCIGRLSEFLN